MASQVTQVLTQYPLPAPQITDSQDVFSQRAFSKAENDVVLVTQINTLVSQMNTVATDVNTNSNTATTKANDAANSATAAQNSANAAASIANVWVSGSSYTLGNIVYSPVNFQTYRAKTTHSGITTDPSSDATRWVALVATINNTLTSTSTTDALSAAQGKVLQDGKQATLVSGTNIKTVNGTSVLGGGDIAISAGMTNAVYDLTGNITLAANVNRNIVINSSTAEYSITLPDATQVTANGGVMFNFINRSTYIIRVLDAGGNIVFSVPQKSTVQTVCISIASTNGMWVSANKQDVSPTSNILTLLANENLYYYNVSIVNLDSTRFLVVTSTKAIVVTINAYGTVASIGTPLSHGIASVNYISTVLVNTDSVVCTYIGTSNYVYGIVISISGTTPSFGTPVTIQGLGGGNKQYTFSDLISPNTNKILQLRIDSNSYSYVDLWSVSGTTLTNSATLQLAANTYAHWSLSKIGTDKSIALCGDNANSGHCKILTTTTNSISGTNGIQTLYFRSVNSPRGMQGGFLNGKVAVLVDAGGVSSAQVPGFLNITFFATSGTAPVVTGQIRLDFFNTYGSASVTPYLKVLKVSDSLCLITTNGGSSSINILVDVAKQAVVKTYTPILSDTASDGDVALNDINANGVILTLVAGSTSTIYTEKVLL